MTLSGIAIERGRTHVVFLELAIEVQVVKLLSRAIVCLFEVGGADGSRFIVDSQLYVRRYR